MTTYYEVKVEDIDGTIMSSRRFDSKGHQDPKAAANDYAADKRKTVGDRKVTVTAHEEE